MSVKVLLVGKGAPDTGGIATYLRLLLEVGVPGADLALLNVAHAGERQGGRLSAGNIRRTARDAVDVWRRAGGVDVVHLHSALAPGVTLLRASLLAAAARARGVKVIVHAHGGLAVQWLDRRPRRLVARLALALADEVLAVSDTVAAALEAAIGRPVPMLPNGVDTTRFTPSPSAPPPPPVVLYVGLLTPRKGVLDLIEASKRLHERGVDHRLVLVGGTPDEGVEGERAVRARLHPGIEAQGPRDFLEMPEVYRNAHVFCLPSWWEASPLSVLEAMASGLPVVATAVGDIPRLLGEESGAVVAPRQPDALADALASVLLDEERRRAVGRAARRTAVAQHSAAQMSARLARHYTSAPHSAP